MLKDIVTPNCKTDKFTTHTYLETYEKFLDNKTDIIKNVLEIGIERGGSMELWSQYFPNAHIYGVDINTIPSSNPDRITHINGDAYQEEFINNNFNNMKFDLLIDDGSHRFEHMQFFIHYYSKLLAPSGIMIIEDIPDINWVDKLLQSRPIDLAQNTSYTVVDNRYINGRWDDILLVIH